MPIVAQGHDTLLQSTQSMIVDGLSASGGKTTTYSNGTELDDATHLLVPGVGAWGSSQLEHALERAGRCGVKRVLWQMETLPPPDLPNSLCSKILLRSGAHRTRGLSRHLANIALKRMAKECRPLPWNQPTPIDARPLRLPVREARYIKKLWRANLIDKIIVCQKTRQKFLKGMGIPSVFMPFGYHKKWGKPDLESQRDIDVLYIGTPTPRRISLLSQTAQDLANKGFHIKVVESGLYGEERTKMIGRSKILLHFRNYPWELPRLRIMMAIAAGSLYVTEQFSDTDPFVSGEHFAMAQPENIPSTIIHFLRNEAERFKITRYAARFVEERLDLGQLLLRACC
jgi:hypothetical protein